MRLSYILFLFFLCSFAANSASVINGRIINASRNDAPVPGLDLFLQKLSPSIETPVTVAEGKTSRKGTFRLSVDHVDALATYFVVSDFEGVRYYSDGIKLMPGKPIDVVVTVRDTTHSTAGVEAFMHHIIINDIGSFLQFRETHLLNNPGDKTITHALTDETVGPALFKFHLPHPSQNYKPISTHTARDLVFEGHYVYDRGVFLPGKKTLAFTYEVPMQEKQLPIAVHVPHTARTFDIFVGSDNIVIDSGQLEDYGKVHISGTEYHRYGAANVPAGTDIRFTVKRLRRAFPLQSPVLALTLTSGLLLLVLIYSRGKGSKSATASNMSADDLTKRRQELIDAIASLDISAPPGKQEKRRKLMNELLSIELQQRNASKKSHRRK